MGMRLSRVKMRVRMPFGNGLTGVGMGVVPVTVGVAVFVFLFPVGVNMGVLLLEQQGNGEHKQTRRQAMLPGKGFAKQHNRQQNAPERRTGKNQLAAGCAQLLCRRDVQHNTQPIRHYPHA